MRAVICDGCGRQCYDGAYTTVNIATKDRPFIAPRDQARDYCHASDGGSIGCAQLILSKLDEIDRRAGEAGPA